MLIFLDKYDTLMQEAYVNGHWEELAAYWANTSFNSPTGKRIREGSYLRRVVCNRSAGCEDVATIFSFGQYKMTMDSKE